MNRAEQTEEAIFNAAQSFKDPEKLRAYLDLACDGDPNLRQRLERLLAVASGADDFFQRNSAAVPHVSVPPEVTFVSSISEGPGTIIGRYKLLEKIGEGGMGVVYMAEQREPIVRKVALKIIKLGMDTRSVVARFEAERQALAMMDHPNIAKVLDGGATETGRPYFVMELVQGVPITEFCETNRLPPGERLKLFIPVCQAIQSAHQKGIIHRDIKPSNVLVTLHNGVPVPKVIDFGVAKATNHKLTEKTLFTNYATMIGTPAYMSPEQAEMSGLDIDTRSDIYGLGVLLYELLTGTTPFSEKRLRSVAYSEMQRIIIEEEPERPSTRLRRTSLAGSPSQFITRHSSLSTDLDWIVMKCLEKDRNRRYETANGLASDIQRHLSNEPVVARPPSTGYRFQKLVRRNKLAFATGAAIALALLAGIAATSWQAIRASRAEQQQRLERARAESRLKATMRFFDQAFNSVAPALADVIGMAQPRELLARAAADVIEDLRQGDEPNAEAREVLGQLYLQLALSHGWLMGNTTGDYEAALSAATNAIQMLETAAAASPTDRRLKKLFSAEQAAGMIYFGLLEPHDAIEHFQKSHRWATRLGEQTTNSGLQNLSVAMKGWAKVNIGEIVFRMGRYEEALTNYYLPEMARLRERGNSDQSTNIGDVWDLKGGNDSLGMAYSRLERYNEALPYLQEALRLMEVIKTRRPHSAQFSSALAIVRAEVGEVLLCLNQPQQGLELLHQASALADELAERDQANAGFAQVQIEVLWRSAAGNAAWANESSASIAERRSRLDQAQNYLDRAQTLLAGLKSESLRNFLAADLRPITAKVAAAKTNLETHKVSP